MSKAKQRAAARDKSPTLSDTNADSNSNTMQFDDEMSAFIQDIDCLQQHGINMMDIKKLKQSGICTIRGLEMTTRKRLCLIKGLSEAKVEKIKEAVLKVSNDSCFKTAHDVKATREMVFKVSTGSEELDKILGGGIESMSITEAHGEYRSGKTQLSHTLCVTVQMGTNGRSGGKAMFIDTENTFRPDRLSQIAARFDLDEHKVLENVLTVRVFNSEHQFELMDHVAAKFHEEQGQFKLLVIDSVMALFRVDYSGRGELAERQQKLAQFLARVQRISEEYNVAVFMTNQMTSDPGAGMSFGPTMKPIGGNILAHAATVRLYLRKGKGETRIAKISDSPDMPEGEATFAITPGGIADAKE